MKPEVTTAPPVAEAWQDGAPLALPSEAVVIDLHVYALLRCPRCGRRMAARPQHTARGRYRVLCECRCGERSVA